MMHVSELMAQLEPGIAEADKTIPSYEVAAQISIAISLKRLADMLTAPCNEYGETFAEAIVCGIERAIKGHQA